MTKKKNSSNKKNNNFRISETCTNPSIKMKFKNIRGNTNNSKKKNSKGTNKTKWILNSITKNPINQKTIKGSKTN